MFVAVAERWDAVSIQIDRSADKIKGLSRIGITSNAESDNRAQHGNYNQYQAMAVWRAF
jgi:hypothetical protein